jgi:hypothetical protein
MYRVLQPEVGRPGHPVEFIEVAAGVLDDLERFGQYAESTYRRIVQLRHPWLLDGSFGMLGTAISLCQAPAGDVAHDAHFGVDDRGFMQSGCHPGLRCRVIQAAFGDGGVGIAFSASPTLCARPEPRHQSTDAKPDVS